MSPKYRQEVFNVLLAQLLQERGVITAPETILTQKAENMRRLPDVIVNYHGLRIVIEGEVSDQPDAEARSLRSARKRVEEGIAHIAVGIIYPAYLREERYENLKKRMSECQLQITVVTESEVTGFVKGDITFLENILRRAYDKLVEEDVVANAVAALEVGIENFAGVVMRKEALLKRMAQILGIKELPAKEKLPEESE